MGEFGEEDTPRRNSEGSRRNSEIGAINRPFRYNPILEFPKFDGNNPRMWIKKCTRYFNLCSTSEEQKVDLACSHMVDKAEVWMSSYMAIMRNVEWSEFVIDLIARFKDEVGIHVVENFNKL